MRLVISFFVVAFIALGVLTACNSAEWKDARTSPVAPAPAGSAPSDGIRRVTVTELKELLARDQAMVIDVRNESSFAMGHITGARLIPEAEVANHVDELPKNKLVVTYCS
jgi:3-mercaptopyruvate sulfurtransferase SseA